MWIFYEISYYFDENDVCNKVSEQPIINDTVFTDKQKLIQFLEFYYGLNNYANGVDVPQGKNPLKITDDLIPTVPGDCKRLFVIEKADDTAEMEYVGFIKKMQVQTCPEDDIAIYSNR